MVALPTPGASPNIGNLTVPRGYFSADFGAGFVDLGFCREAQLTMHPTLLHYYSPRDGIRKKVLSVITQLDASLTMILDEPTAQNMGMALLGTAGSTIEFMSNPRFYAALKFTATSAYGVTWDYSIPLALLTPKQGVELIAKGSGDWGMVSITCDVQFDLVSNSFGFATQTN